MHFSSSITAILTAGALVSAQANVFLIRHGEKPSDGSNGLSAQGMQRAQCLRTVFGASSGYNIGSIITQAYKSDGSRERPFETVEPLSQDLGLTINHSCDRDDPDCVQKLVDNYTGSGNILICWEHDALTGIVSALGDSNAPTYPSDHYDIIWSDPFPYTSIESMISEDCQGLDA